MRIGKHCKTEYSASVNVQGRAGQGMTGQGVHKSCVRFCGTFLAAFSRLLHENASSDENGTQYSTYFRSRHPAPVFHPATKNKRMGSGGGRGAGGASCPPSVPTRFNPSSINSHTLNTTKLQVRTIICIYEVYILHKTTRTSPVIKKY